MSHPLRTGPERGVRGYPANSRRPVRAAAAVGWGACCLIAAGCGAEEPPPAAAPVPPPFTATEVRVNGGPVASAVCPLGEPIRVAGRLAPAAGVTVRPIQYAVAARRIRPDRPPLLLGSTGRVERGADGRFSATLAAFPTEKTGPVELNARLRLDDRRTVTVPLGTVKLTRGENSAGE